MDRTPRFPAFSPVKSPTFRSWPGPDDVPPSSTTNKKDNLRGHYGERGANETVFPKKRKGKKSGPLPTGLFTNFRCVSVRGGWFRCVRAGVEMQTSIRNSIPPGWRYGRVC
jgi:hypothetical protein